MRVQEQMQLPGDDPQPNARPRPAAPASPGLSLGLVVLVVLVAGGCGDGGDAPGRIPNQSRSLGLPCNLQRPGDDLAVLSVNDQASECASHICLSPAVGESPGSTTGALCTIACRSDDDCKNGITRFGPGAGCHSGFVCRQIVPNLANNPVACQRLCVCVDFVPANEGPPAATGCP